MAANSVPKTNNDHTTLCKRMYLIKNRLWSCCFAFSQKNNLIFAYLYPPVGTKEQIIACGQVNRSLYGFAIKASVQYCRLVSMLDKLLPNNQICILSGAPQNLQLKRELWKVKPSTTAKNCKNLIREIVEGLNLQPNPEKPVIALSLGL